MVASGFNRGDKCTTGRKDVTVHLITWSEIRQQQYSHGNLKVYCTRVRPSRGGRTTVLPRTIFAEITAKVVRSMRFGSFHSEGCESL